MCINPDGAVHSLLEINFHVELVDPSSLNI
jgi:hypothetical protein